MTQYFLGIDVGSTKSHALIADDTGQVIGFGKSGAGNYETVGYEGYAQTLQTATQGALAAAGLTVDQIAGAGFGVAGYDWPSERPLMVQGVATLGLSAPYQIVNDAVISLIAGATQGWGVVIGAGTGCNCRGRDQTGREGRVVGNGPPFGEYGGGYELVYKAVEAVSRAWSLRGPATKLAQVFADYVGADDVTDLIAGLATGRCSIGADAAPLVFATAREGDAVAQDVITWVSHELGGLANGVIRQLGLEDATFDVVLAGSFYKGSPVIAETIRDVVHTLAPGARLVPLNAAPVVGGVMLAMEQAGVNFVPLRDRLLASAQDVMNASGSR